MTESGTLKRYTVGTLVYTPGGLAVLFSWLLWGDFIFTLMESVMPSLLPLILKQHGASNREIAVIVTSIYMVINGILNPVISYNSDRFRSKWGRRRPFIFVTTPFVVLFLCLIPFAPEILNLIKSAGWVSSLLSFSPIAPVILMFGFLVVGFQVFNMFISSVYYYLIPDVVPDDHLGRFYGLFRIFGTLAGVIFNYFIFGMAETHMKEIFVIIGIAYGFFILLMCWRVKEGEYPPPIKEEHDHWWSGVKNYAKECYGHEYYWWVFLTYSCLGWAGCSNVFSVFFYRDEIGFSLDLIGKMGAYSGILIAVLAYPFGVLLDRWGCHKSLITSMLLSAITSLLAFYFSVDKASTFIIHGFIRTVPTALAALALFKWIAEVYPRDRYGQFGSAGALFSCIGGMMLGPLCGILMDWIGIYRYFMLWQMLFYLLGAFGSYVVYKKWQALGGIANYRAP